MAHVRSSTTVDLRFVLRNIHVAQMADPPLLNSNDSTGLYASHGRVAPSFPFQLTVAVVATSNRHTKPGDVDLIRHFGLSMSVTATECYHPTIFCSPNWAWLRCHIKYHGNSLFPGPSTLCHSFLCCYSQSPRCYSQVAMPGNREQPNGLSFDR